MEGERWLREVRNGGREMVERKKEWREVVLKRKE